ncbi:MAG: DegV family EDD domain-containing protein [Deltaproteobacteria bacterium]|nr:DegV family EDD domain-containing protein [Deltaproteobacteria bacterium]
MNQLSSAIDKPLMKSKISEAFVAGVDRVSAWADLLDSINVFPVADGDTGRNLVISLQPLRQPFDSLEELIEALLLSARGNSGNIAAQFFSAFVSIETLDELTEVSKQGRDLAWKAVTEPKSGTMLSIFDALVEALHQHDVVSNSKGVEQVLDILEGVVFHTSEQLTELANAGVVDAGALGMFIFFDGFFNVVFDRKVKFRSIAEVFENLLHVNPSWRADGDDGYCIDAVLKLGSGDTADSLSAISQVGHEVVTMGHGDFVKVHLHAPDEAGARRRLEGVGNLVNWKSDDLKAQTAEYLSLPKTQALHIMSDAAGSLTRTDAKRLGITLLESYINLGLLSYPETHMDPEELYGEMRKGTPASTAQASVFERHQRYQQAASLHPQVLYLCVGAGYTGNYQTVMDWKAQNDPADKLVVVDTEAASGKLGLLAIATARFSLKAENAVSVVKYAQKAQPLVEELIFIEKLQYLARGGRISKTGAFFGDMLHVKPVVSPAADGVKKVGVVRNKGQQISFALEKLKEALKGTQSPLIMLQYTDNRSLVEGEFKGAIEREFPWAEVFTQPLSLTTGTHCGPGAWAMAFLPDVPV